MRSQDDTRAIEFYVQTGRTESSLKHGIGYQQAEYDGTLLFIDPLGLGQAKNWRRPTKKLVSEMRTSIVHHNLLNMIGISTLSDQVDYFLFDSAHNGSLHFVLHTTRYTLNDTIKYNFASDVANAMAFLHRKHLMHGLISSLTVFVDATWTTRLGSWEKYGIYNQENPKKFETLTRYYENYDLAGLVRLLYLDPEVQCEYDAGCDIYSFGLLLVEIFTKRLPYHEAVRKGEMSYENLLRAKFVTKSRLPEVCDARDALPPRLLELVHACIGPESNRPTPDRIVRALDKLKPSRKGIVDTMLEAMENHTDLLENKVAARKAELAKLSGRMRALLHEVLPPQVAERLLSGEQVQPEFFEHVTIYFSDIDGFAHLCEVSTPLQVMEFLNEMCVMFDQTIERFDVYKADTINDQYMIGSGIPNRNGQEHCRQIVELALALMANCCQFKIRHMPKQRVRLRIGINSGSVTAGVVGTKMPQYCIFGDTVNTASRMESTSEPLRIQVSSNTHALIIDHFPQYKMTYRGEISVKGKGQMRTYWLDPPDDHPVHQTLFSD